MAGIGLQTVTSTGILSVAVLLSAYVYRRHLAEDLRQHLDSVLDGLLRAESKVAISQETRVAVGFGSCLDVVSDGIEVLNAAGARPPQHPEHTQQIASRSDLEKIFTYFFQHGAAAERFVEDQELFRNLTWAADQLSDTLYKVGGNAPVMARRFLQEGCAVLLGAQMSQQLRAQVEAEIHVAGALMEEDDIHLLLEYSKGRRWGKYMAPRANRFIVHSDINNPTLSSMEAFAEELMVFSPTLLVIGGLQMMDNFPFLPGQRKERLHRLSKVLADIPTETKIHFEMASFAEEACLRDVIENVATYSDSLGMNEQELPNLHSVLTNGSVTLISDPYPRIATTLDQMRAIFSLLKDAYPGTGHRKLTRLHVHTLAFQAIMTRKGSSWKNSMSAAAKASLTAHRHTCGSDAIDVEKAKLLMDESFSMSREKGSNKIHMDNNRPVSCWEEGDFEICIAPVLVCTEVVQTGGGGDNISSAGLVLQV